MKKKNSRILAKRKRKIAKRLKRKQWKNQHKPMFSASNIHYEMDGRRKGIASGGIGAIHLMNKKLGFVADLPNKPRPFMLRNYMRLNQFALGN